MHRTIRPESAASILLAAFVSFAVTAQAVTYVDIASDQTRQTVVAEGGLRLPEGYQGHPTTVLTREGKILCVWTFGHGGPCGPAAESVDGGRTWTRIDDRFPAVYAATHKNCPTLQKCVRKDGGERLFVFSAKFKDDPRPKVRYTRVGVMISDDGGVSWREAPVADVSGAMPPTGFMPLNDGSLALFGQLRDTVWTGDAEPTDDQRIWMSVSTDDGETWGPMRVVAAVKERNLCEPCCVRSPDGEELVLLLRENRHRDCSMMCFSSDEGKTWSKPVLTSSELTGDRHEALALADGRYLVCFRDQMKKSPTAGQFVGWIGTWDDLKNARPGEYRIRLLNHHGVPNAWPGNEWDTGYPGVERLPNGDILCMTYSRHYEGPRHSSVVCTRFRPEELPTLARGTPVSEVLDFGPDGVAGYPEITVTGVTAPVRVRVSYATHPDGLGPKGDFWHETRANYMGEQLWLPILPANTDRFDLFEIPSNGTYRASLLQGLVRYVRVKAEVGSVIVTDVRFVNDGVYSTEKQVGSFQCSDARVNGVWDASVRTCRLAAIPARTRPLAARGVHTNATLGTTHAYLSDGAKRDRLVWSGDLWFAQRNLYAAFDFMSPFMPGSIRMLGENRTPDGYVQACPFPESHGPLNAGDYGPFASDEFAAWFIPVLRDHVLHSGDLKLAHEQFAAVRALVGYLDGHTGKDGVFEQRLDTCKHSCGLAVGGTSLHHRSYMNILNWKVYSDAASLADWLNEKADAARWRTLANRTAKAIRAAFWDGSKGCFVLSREERVLGFEANALALAVRFATEAEAKAILPQLSRCWHGKFQALAVRGAFEYGAAEKAMELVANHNWYRYLERNWKGTRTVQECANLSTKGWGDEAHPDACLAGIFTNYLLGLEPLEPGYRTFRVRPQPTKDVTSACGEVSTPYGMLSVEWHLEGGRPVVAVKNPKGTREVKSPPEKPVSLSFRGETDKDPLSYACGETISFVFTLVDRNRKNEPVNGRAVAWTRTGDDGREERGTAVTDGPVTVRTKLDRPGFVHVVIQAVDENGKPVKGSDKYDTSAAADVWKIPATPMPADFNAFWDRELARMRSVTMKGVLTPRDAKDPEVALYEFSVNTIPGEGPATGLVAWPMNASSNSLPIHIDVPGYGYGVVPVRNAAVKKGVIEMVITRHGEDPLASKDYHENLWTNVLQGYGWRNNNTRTGNDMFRMVMRDVRAAEFAKSLPQWDGKTLTVSGPSMGGYRSIALAAFDPAVTACNPVYPWMCDLSGAKLHGRLGGWLPAWTDELAYVDGANIASRVTCPVDLCFGLADYVCPPSGLMVMIRNLKGPVNFRVQHGVGHGCGWGVHHPDFKHVKPAAVPGADGRSVWGGSFRLPRQEATGRFRLARIGEAMWIVDPEGCPFRNLAEKVAAVPSAPARPTPYVYVLKADSPRLGKDQRAMRDPDDEAFKPCLEWDLAGKRGIMHDPWCLGFLVDDDVDFASQSEARVCAYFAGTREGVKRLDKSLLYFGCRFRAKPPAWVEKIAGEYADVLCGNGCFVDPDTLHLYSE